MVFIGAFEVLHLVQGAGLKADCKLYTTLISTCAKCGKVDAMFEVRALQSEFVVVLNLLITISTCACHSICFPLI